MNIPRSPHPHDFGADDSVKGWLVNYAQAHLHDPGKDHIILSDPSRKIVYDSYENDFKQGVTFYFPKKQDDYYLPSLSYFMRCWRTMPALKTIVLRKYLHFALSDECVQFRLRRKYATTDAERRQIKKEENLHHSFVHEERATGDRIQQ